MESVVYPTKVIRAELEEQVRRIDAGEEKLIPWEEVRDCFLPRLGKE